MQHRTSHYWFWAILFGLVPFIQTAVNHFPANVGSYSAYWLLGTGILGILVGMKSFSQGNLAKPYDWIVGLIFTIAGVVGVIGYFSGALGSIATYVNDVGLATSGLYPLIFTFLGLKSIHHALDKKG